jgi:ribosome-binding protein aMBF1 (putative translation factor)
MKDETSPEDHPGINSRIANRVRALRAELGMSLDALAAK